MIIIDYPYLLDHLHPQLSVFDINDGDVLTRMNYKELENFLIHQASKRIKPTYEEVHTTACIFIYFECGTLGRASKHTRAGEERKY